MSQFRRLAIPLMFAGLVLAVLYALFSASSKGSNTDPVAKYATGTLQNLDTSERGAPAPAAIFTGPSGMQTTLQAYAGQTVLINFWATWCAPCEREMPSLAALQTARGSQDFKVIAISVDSAEDRDYAQKRLRDLSGGVLDFYHAPPEDWDIVYESGARRGFPTTVLYGADGLKVAQLAGDADWASYEAVALIDTILKQ